MIEILRKQDQVELSYDFINKLPTQSTTNNKSFKKFKADIN